MFHLQQKKKSQSIWPTNLFKHMQIDTLCIEVHNTFFGLILFGIVGKEHRECSTVYYALCALFFLSRDSRIVNVKCFVYKVFIWIFYFLSNIFFCNVIQQNENIPVWFVGSFFSRDLFKLYTCIVDNSMNVITLSLFPKKNYDLNEDHRHANRISINIYIHLFVRIICINTYIL